MIRAALTTALILLGACAAQPQPRAERTPQPAAPEPAPDPAPRRAASTEIGRSVAGRPITATTIGRGPVRVLLVAGFHHEHDAASRAIGPLLDALDSPDLAQRATILAIPDANPDGRQSASRANAHAIDLDRNFPASDFEPDGGAPGRRYGPSPLTEPESRAVHDQLHAFAPDLVLILDIARSGPSVAWSPADLPAPARAAAEGAQRHNSRTRLLPNTGRAPGSLASLAGDDLRIPTVTLALPFEAPDRRTIDALASAVRAAIGEVR